LSPIILRRSALFLPASNARAIEKARELPTDVVIFDLEDSVSVECKAVARRQCCNAIQAGGFDHRELVIRINGVGTPWYEDDLAAALKAVPQGILLPKVESGQTIVDVARRLEVHGAPKRMRIWCMLETPRGVLAAQEILQSHERLAVAVMGTSDLTRDLHAQHTPQRLALLTALGLCLLAARANGLDILDGVCLDLDDEVGFRQACEQSKQLGFDGKTLIHPRQIEPCNAVFSPTLAEVTSAREIVTALAKARDHGQGVAVVGGRLVEDLHVSEARRVIARHEAATPKRPV
jgi:citrate lyase subunit beta / citryl-CoA lyase